MSNEHDDGAVHHHITPIPVYLGVFGALIFFTAATVGAYNIRLGEANLGVAILIATVKATLVIAFFMHMLHERRFNLVVLIGALVFVTIFLAYTMNDTQTRGVNQSMQGVWVNPDTGELSPGVGSVEEGTVVIDGRRFEDYDVTHPESAEHGAADHAEAAAEESAEESPEADAEEPTAEPTAEPTEAAAEAPAAE